MPAKAVVGPLSQLTIEIHDLVRQAAENVLAIGSRLIQVKDHLAEHPEHGTFQAWLSEEFGWSKSTAHNFMRVSLSFKPHTHKICELSPSVLYLLASPSVAEETRQEVLDRAAAGEDISNAKAKEIIEERRSIDDSLRGLSEEAKLELLRAAEEEEDDEDDEQPEPKTEIEWWTGLFARAQKRLKRIPKNKRAAVLLTKAELEVKHLLS